MALNRDKLDCLVNEIHHVDATSVSVVETDPGGAGTFRFNVDNECLCIRLPEKAVRWMKEEDCADGAIFEFSPGGLRLHLVELKSTINSAKVIKLKKQFYGAYYNACFIATLLNLGPITEVILHVAYTRERFGNIQTTAPVTLKTLTGRPESSTVAEWRARRLTLSGLSDAFPLNVVERDASGNAVADLGTGCRPT